MENGPYHGLSIPIIGIGTFIIREIPFEIGWDEKLNITKIVDQGLGWT